MEAQTFFSLENSEKKYIEYLSYIKNNLVQHPLSELNTDEKIIKILKSDSTGSINSYMRQKCYHFVDNMRDTSYLNTNILSSFSSSKIDTFNYRFDFSTNYKFKSFTAGYTYVLDKDYQKDKNYFGSIGKFGHEVLGRSSRSYLKYSKRNLILFAGRVNRNFGLINSKSLILSNNPFSYDHFSLTLKNSLFHFFSLFTRLDDKEGYDVRDDPRQINWNKRYFSFHRLDISFSENLKLGLSESVLYTGTNQNMLANYSNPMNFFFISKMVERKGIQERDANILLAIDFLFKPRKNLIFFSQFLIDDTEFTRELRRRYPDRLGYLGKIIVLDLIKGSMLSFGYTTLSNYTYNSYYTNGNYTFFGKSIGFPFNGYKSFDITFDFFSMEDYVFSLGIFSNIKRNQDLDSHFVDEKNTSFPLNPAQKSVGCFLDISLVKNLNGSIIFHLKAQSFENYLYEPEHKKVNYLAQLKLNYYLSKDIFIRE